MSVQGFSRSDSLRFGWETMKRNLGLSVGVAVAAAVAYFLASGLTQAAEGVPALVTVFAIGTNLVQVLFAMVWIRLGLSLHDARPVRARDLVPSGLVFLNYLAVSILYGLLVGVGLVLLIVPGIYLAIRYGLAGFLVVDGKADALGAFSRSAQLTRGARGSLFVLLLALLGMNLLGLLVFGVGLLFTIPATAYALARAYRQLEQRAELVAEPQALQVVAPA